ncbi:aminotransferase class V-fold PLP-dependent enzyme [Deinococcus sp. NW-56]|uniref:aminotransferase class V-fold PLP-dependent enzyme n=1 Tax=Deinococcus sp. NW-56 TaxID=2080419 RepID=UPI000CF44C7C|nr:aminotransferase class V-fold PLP-dependent enzyme [Deinococcus sp. NW-56]
MSARPHLLLTPGPTPLHPAAREALGHEALGHMDPEVFALNGEIQADLRTLYGAPDGTFTALLAGTGSLGMEAGFANLVEPGDEVLIGVNGSFGARMAEMAARYGARVRTVTAAPGEPLNPAAFVDALAGGRVRLVAVVHGETSTGVLNPLSEIAEAVRGNGALLSVDAVTTAGMQPFDMAGLEADYVYTGSQKCLSAPPGVAPVAVSGRALARHAGRRTPVPLWYADFAGLRDYWEAHSYHHTVPVSLHFALHAALRAALDEGLPQRQARAAEVGRGVLAALEPLGFTPFVPDPDHRLPTVLALRLPPGLDDAATRAALRARGVSVAGGMGATAGQIWRLGLMGEGARPALYHRFLTELEAVMGVRGAAKRFGAVLSEEVLGTSAAPA